MDPDKLRWQLKLKQSELCLNQQPELCAVWKGQQLIDEGRSVSFQKEFSELHWLLAFFCAQRVFVFTGEEEEENFTRLKHLTSLEVS